MRKVSIQYIPNVKQGIPFIIASTTKRLYTFHGRTYHINP